MDKINLKTLPEYDDLEIIFHALGANNARLVGGCTRDLLCGRPVTDFDFATIHTPDITIEKLTDAGIKSIPTGIKYGTITAVINKKNYEITTLRKDVETFGRDANVMFTDIWEEDAKRRDFTMNAIYLDFDGNIYDYFDGQTDLKNRLIKFIGDAETRIEEDHLRILRYFRFIAYLGKENLDSKSLDACKKLASTLMKLSGERIHNEFHKMFHVEHLVDAINLMDKCGVLKVLGFNNTSPLPPEIITTTDNFHIKFAIFLICFSKEMNRKDLLKKYKFSKEEIKKILLLANWDYSHNFESTLDSARYYKGAESVKNLILTYCLLNHKSPDIYAKYQKSIPTFPINGDDLKKIGYNGELLGQKLKKLETFWIESNFTLSKTKLLNEIEK